MQHRILRRVVLSFAVVIVAVSSLTLLGCGGDDEEIRNVNRTISLDSTSAGNGSTSIVNGVTFPGISSAVLAANAQPPAPQLANQTVSLGFANVSGSTGTFALTGQNVTSTGNVRFASCTFTVTTSNNAAVLPVGTVITISNCTVFVSATGVPVGEIAGTGGTITLSLNGTTSQPVNTTVALQDDGTLVVTNGAGTAVVITGVIITGTSGG